MELKVKCQEKPKRRCDRLWASNPKTCFELVLDKMAEITYFLWGRNGFDGDKEA
jgi:hypothetical protein